MHRDSVISLDTIMKPPFVSKAFMTREQISSFMTQIASALDQYNQALADFNPSNFNDRNFAWLYEKWLSLRELIARQRDKKAVENTPPPR